MQVNIVEAQSNLTIETEDSNHTVYGYLNKLFQLTCTVIQGIPKGKLLWIVNNRTLAETGTSSLVLSFKPKQQDHLKQFTCAAISNFTEFELQRSVQLFVYSKCFLLYSKGIYFLLRVLCISKVNNKCHIFTC